MMAWKKPPFNSAEENYKDALEFLRQSLEHRHVGSKEACKTFRFIIRQEIQCTRELRAKCKPEFVKQIRALLKG